MQRSFHSGERVVVCEVLPLLSLPVDFTVASLHSHKQQGFKLDCRALQVHLDLSCLQVTIDISLLIPNTTNIPCNNFFSMWNQSWVYKFALVCQSEY